MQATGFLLIVLLAAATVACGFAVWAMRELVGTARSVRMLSDDTREKLVPLLDKADITVDAVNAELLRIDAIITQLEETSARVSHASGTISEIVSAPGEIVNDVATRVRRAWKDRRRAEDADMPEQDGDLDAETETEPAPGLETEAESESEPANTSEEPDTRPGLPRT